MAADSEAPSVTQEKPFPSSTAKKDLTRRGVDSSVPISSPSNPSNPSSPSSPSNLSSTSDSPDQRATDFQRHNHRPDTSEPLKHSHQPAKTPHIDTGHTGRKHRHGHGPRIGDSTHTRALSVDLEKQEFERSSNSSVSHFPATTMADSLCEHEDDDGAEDQRVLQENALNILVRLR